MLLGNNSRQTPPKTIGLGAALRLRRNTSRTHLDAAAVMGCGATRAVCRRERPAADYSAAGGITPKIDGIWQKPDVRVDDWQIKTFQTVCERPRNMSRIGQVRDPFFCP